MKPILPAIIALLALSACHSKPAAAPDTTQSQASVQVSNARLVLPAVPGRPAAAYFTIANHSAQPATVTGIALDGAGQAEMHVTKGGAMEPLAQLPLGAGETAQFAPGGRHVMVFDLAPKLVAGGTTGITFTFADGRKLSAQMQIEAPGGIGPMDHMGPSGMGNMDHMKM